MSLCLSSVFSSQQQLSIYLLPQLKLHCSVILPAFTGVHARVCRHSKIRYVSPGHYQSSKQFLICPLQRCRPPRSQRWTRCTTHVMLREAPTRQRDGPHCLNYHITFQSSRSRRGGRGGSVPIVCHQWKGAQDEAADRWANRAISSHIQWRAGDKERIIGI